MESVMAENQRKSEKIIKLEAELESNKERLDKLEEIASNRQLTESEEKEVDDLSMDIKQQVKALRSQDATKPWMEIAREEAESASEKKSVEVFINSEIERGNEFIEDKSYELNMPVKELVEKMKPFTIQYDNKTPRRRNELAFRDMLKSQEREKRLAEREKAVQDAEDAEIRFRESGTRIPRDTAKEQRFEQSDAKGRTNVLVDLLDGSPGEYSK